ncbi:MAG: hypothetical protein JKY48_04270 [Flavobacteriales bacterium]|nr:hypothetical protein [Flavobacteriales bacterium]
MKAIYIYKALIMSFCFFSLPFIGAAQAIGDSLTIYIENRIELKIAIEDYDHLRDSNDVAKHLSSFQKHLGSIKAQLNSEDADLVTYTPDSALSLKKIDKENIFLIQKDQVLNTGFRDKAVIQLEGISISLTTSDLSTIDNISLSDCFAKLIPVLPEKTRLASFLYFQCKNGTVTYLEDKTIGSQLDAIELSFGAGASLLKNKWVGDLSFRIGIRLNKKGALQHYPYVSANLMYDFPSSNKVNINTFLTLGYRWSINNKDADLKTMGAEFAYLVSRQGDAFKEGTFRVGLSWNPIDAVSFSPQIYFPGGIKNAYPGVRIGFGF